MNKWKSKIDSTTDDFLNLFGSLSIEVLNWKPGPDQWSIAQNIHHLITINKSYFPILADLKSGQYKAPFIAKFSFIVSFLGKMLLKSIAPGRKKKIKTFPIWEPTQSQIPSEILKIFANHQADLIREIEACEDLVKSGAIISSPANRNIVYKLATAFDIIVTHERRHLEQAKEVLDMYHQIHPESINVDQKPVSAGV